MTVVFMIVVIHKLNDLMKVTVFYLWFEVFLGRIERMLRRNRRAMCYTFRVFAAPQVRLLFVEAANGVLYAHGCLLN